MKLAMCRVSAVLKEKYPTATMLLQVHDELVLECYPDDAEAIADMLSHEMINIVTSKYHLWHMSRLESHGEIYIEWY